VSKPDGLEAPSVLGVDGLHRLMRQPEFQSGGDVMSKQAVLYETLGKVASFTRPGKSYTIKRSLLTGQVSCDCPAWRFQRGPTLERKPCKHIRAMKGGAK
jgi:hypothetical protein